MKLKLIAFVGISVAFTPLYALTSTSLFNYHHFFTPHEIQEPCAERVCIIKKSDMIMNSATQNISRSLPNPCIPFWYDRIGFSGGINVDMGKFGNRSTNYMGVNYQRFSINDAYLNFAAYVNDWITGFASISFSTPTVNPNPVVVDGFPLAEYDAAYSNNINDISPRGFTTVNNTTQIEQAFFTIANYDVWPVFFQAGKEFQDFSRYQIHPITVSLTQAISEILATSIKIGFITDDGFHGSLSLFDDPIDQIGTVSRATNYVFALGYTSRYDCYDFGWDVGGAYAFNMISVNDTAYSIQSFSGGGYHKHVTGMAFYADFVRGPFNLGLRYTASIQRFNRGDLPKNGVADFTADGFLLPASTGAKPWAAVIRGGYGFHVCHTPQNIYLGYQRSDETAGLNLPEQRMQLGYGIDISHWTNFTLEWDKDWAFKKGNGGTGKRNTNLVTLRASVKFN